MASSEWVEAQLRKTLAPLVDEHNATRLARLPERARRTVLAHLGIHNADSPAEYIADGAAEAEKHANHRSSR